MLPQQQPQQEQQPGAASSGNGSSKQGSSLATVASPSASASTGSGGKRRSFRSLLRSPNWIKKANKEPAHVPPVLTPASSSLSSSTTTTTATATAPTLQATTDRGGLAEMLRRVEALFHTDRLIAAVEALEQLDARLAGDVGEEAMAVKGVMEGDEEVRRRLRMVRERGQACKALLEESHTVRQMCMYVCSWCVSVCVCVYPRSCVWIGRTTMIMTCTHSHHPFPILTSPTFRRRAGPWCRSTGAPRRTGSRKSRRSTREGREVGTTRRTNRVHRSLFER